MDVKQQRKMILKAHKRAGTSEAETAASLARFEAQAAAREAQRAEAPPPRKKWHDNLPPSAALLISLPVVGLGICVLPFLGLYSIIFERKTPSSFDDSDPFNNRNG